MVDAAKLKDLTELWPVEPTAYRWAYYGHGRKLRWTLSTRPHKEVAPSAQQCGVVVQPLYGNPARLEWLRSLEPLLVACAAGHRCTSAAGDKLTELRALLRSIEGGSNG